jgi:hypothetical protein
VTVGIPLPLALFYAVGIWKIPFDKIHEDVVSVRGFFFIIHNGESIEPVTDDRFNIGDCASVEVQDFCNCSTGVFCGVDSIVFSGVGASDTLE